MIVKISSSVIERCQPNPFAELAGAYLFNVTFKNTLYIVPWNLNYWPLHGEAQIFQSLNTNMSVGCNYLINGNYELYPRKCFGVFINLRVPRFLFLFNYVSCSRFLFKAVAVEGFGPIFFYCWKAFFIRY
jgi:hypothetical protein